MFKEKILDVLAFFVSRILPVLVLVAIFIYSIAIYGWKTSLAIWGILIGGLLLICLVAFLLSWVTEYYVKS